MSSPVKSVSRRPGDRVADGPPGPGAHRHLRRPLTPADKPLCQDSPESVAVRLDDHPRVGRTQLTTVVWTHTVADLIALILTLTDRRASD